MSAPERNILRMVAELHVRGYQRLRIVPHIYSLGSWRCGVTYASNIRPDHGAFAVSWDPDDLPQYSSASQADYFGWGDARYASPSRIAKLFIERYPRVAEAGYGPDWEYAGWYVHLLHMTYNDALPFVFADHEPVEWFLHTTREGLSIPLPPPGAARHADAMRQTQFAIDFPPV